MSTTAFPVRQDSDGVGCTDVALRKIVASLYPNKGIIDGLGVSGQNSTSYKVAAGTAICSKGSSDGNTLAYFEGGTVAASANTASNPRIDVIWITSHDITQGDSDNLVTLGCTTGTAAASPSEPSIPSYATKLVAMKVPANASTTSGASQYGSMNYTIPYGASDGVIATFRNSSSGDITLPTSGSGYTATSGSFYLNRKRLVQFNITTTISVALGQKGDMAGGDLSAFYARLIVDNSEKDLREIVIPIYRQTSYFYQYSIELDAGNHTVALRYFTAGQQKCHIFGSGVMGQQIQVVDGGQVN